MIYHYLINTTRFAIGWRWCPGSVWLAWHNEYMAVLEIGRIQVVIYY